MRSPDKRLKLLIHRNMQIKKSLNRLAPRYTSYPTVPHWDVENFNTAQYSQHLHRAFTDNQEELSLYIHLPFCERLCTYCACNTRITKNHSVEKKYISYLLKEWSMYLDIFPGRPIIKEFHLGGGTPTFFAPENLNYLIRSILDQTNQASHRQFSFEGHPANTTREHLQTMYELGFDRLSLGIQDFDPHVQKLINRPQSEDDVDRVMVNARQIGYKRINFDLVHGLPGQDWQSLKKTLTAVKAFLPDRIAFYNYAHVPQLKPAQRSFENELPTVAERWKMTEMGHEWLVQNGYKEVGMDHFALPGDELLGALEKGKLHRNFMGYTAQHQELLVGLGVSAIGDSWTAFGQNEKDLKKYYQLLDQDHLPIVRGHLHSEDDLFYRRKILALMCTFQTLWSADDERQYPVDRYLLDALINEQLLEQTNTALRVKREGKAFIRIICAAFDRRMWQTGKRVVMSEIV